MTSVRPPFKNGRKNCIVKQPETPNQSASKTKHYSKTYKTTQIAITTSEQKDWAVVPQVSVWHCSDLASLKKKTLKHPKACEVKRAQYQTKLKQYQVQGLPIVYMDESGFEEEAIRPYGYSRIGEPCIDSHNWQARRRTNVIGALYEQTLFAIDYFKENINSTGFYKWCKETLIPRLNTKSVIVMDNASFHKKIVRLFNRHGHHVLFLPPYSPDLNPIEKKWGNVKALRKGWLENDLSKLFYDICPEHNTFVLNWL